MEDLFENYMELPQEVKEIIFSLPDQMDYIECGQLVEDLEKVGYTCDYYLDAVPYDLRKL